MKNDTYQLRVKPEDGSIWLVMKKPNQPFKKLKEMTNEILMVLCADISAALDEDGSVKSVERSVSFSDGMSCKINVILTGLPDAQKRSVWDRSAI